MSGQIDELKDELAELIERHAGQNGVYETGIPSLFIVRASQVSQPVYRVYKPCFCFIAQGYKDVLLSQERFEYGPADYLVSLLPISLILA